MDYKEFRLGIKSDQSKKLLQLNNEYSKFYGVKERQKQQQNRKIEIRLVPKQVAKVVNKKMKNELVIVLSVEEALYEWVFGSPITEKKEHDIKYKVEVLGNVEDCIHILKLHLIELKYPNDEDLVKQQAIIENCKNKIEKYTLQLKEKRKELEELGVSE